MRAVAGVGGDVVRSWKAIGNIRKWHVIAHMIRSDLTAAWSRAELGVLSIEAIVHNVDGLTLTQGWVEDLVRETDGRQASASAMSQPQLILHRQNASVVSGRQVFECPV